MVEIEPRARARKDDSMNRHPRNGGRSGNLPHRMGTTERITRRSNQRRLFRTQHGLFGQTLALMPRHFQAAASNDKASGNQRQHRHLDEMAVAVTAMVVIARTGMIPLTVVIAIRDKLPASTGIIAPTLVAGARKGSGMKAGQHAKHRQPLDKGSHRRAQN